MTRIVVLSTGGTIASRYSAEHGSVVSNVAGEELVSALGPLAPGVPVAAEEFSNLGSYRIDLPTAFELVWLSIRGVDTPVVVQGVQHLIHKPVHLDAWPDGIPGTRIVVTAQGLDPAMVRRSFKAFVDTPAGQEAT